MPSAPEEIIRAFLSALEDRDLERAGRLLAPDPKITFPGGAIRHSIEEIVAGSALKYQRVGKTIEHVDVLPRENGTATVYCFGTLQGRWADGTPFAGIRFIDRFELKDGLILRHDVWNDAAYRRQPEGVTAR